MNPNTRSTILILLIAAALIGSAVIWYRFFTATPPQAAVVREETAAVEVGPRELLRLLESLQGLELDLAFLENKFYRSLEDFTPDISLPTAKGRPNPFAPLEKR